MSSLSRDVLMTLFPDGSAWTPASGDDYDLLLDGIADNSEAVRSALDDLRYLRDPARTTILSDLEKEYSVIPVSNATDAERRQRLAAAMFGRSGLPTYELLEQKLTEAGFDVHVWPNDPPVDPAIFLAQAFMMTCGDILPSGNDAQCGEPEAFCAQVGGELLVNGETFIQFPHYIVLCGEPDAQCGEPDAQAGHFNNVLLVAIQYTIPVDPGYWPLIFFVGGDETRADVKQIEELTGKNLFPAPPGVLQMRSSNYGNGIWIAACYSGFGNAHCIVRSSNGGYDWSLIATPTADNHQAVAYGNGIWVGVLYNGVNRIIRSTDDGLTWTGILVPTFLLIDIHYGNGIWIAIPATGIVILRSDDDGLTWTEIAVPAHGSFRVVYGNGVWIIAGYESGGASSFLRSDDDGLTWTQIFTGSTHPFYGIAYGDGIWIAVGPLQIARSIDAGVTWDLTSSPYTIEDVAFGSGTFVAIPGLLAVFNCYSSTNGGITWELFEVPEANDWQNISFGNDTFIVTSFVGVHKILRISLIDINIIVTIASATVPIARRQEFRRIILKYKPMHSWAGLIVTYN